MLASWGPCFAGGSIEIGSGTKGVVRQRRGARSLDQRVMPMLFSQRNRQQRAEISLVFFVPLSTTSSSSSVPYSVLRTRRSRHLQTTLCNPPDDPQTIRK